MNRTWRILDTGKRPAAYNMALERVILTARSQNRVPDTLHFLEFSPHCALVGYHQAVELEVEEEYCRAHGIEINRRISGGGNLYMDEGQLGWEIFALKDTPGIPRRLEDMYRLLCEAAVAGLARLGVKANFRPQNDIEVDGRKISGTGGTEMGNSLLYHGTILTDFDVDTMIACLKLPLKKLENKQIQSFKERVTCLREVLGTVPPMEEIKKAMAEGFAEVLGVTLAPGGFSTYEEQLMERELPCFESDEWIKGARTSQENRLQVVDYKSPGGLIRVSLRLDPSRQRIKYVFITGDFFAYPERSILDLEASLKNAPSHSERLHDRIQRFFAERNVEIPGVAVEDIFQAVWLAVEEARKGEEYICQQL